MIDPADEVAIDGGQPNAQRSLVTTFPKMMSPAEKAEYWISLGFSVFPCDLYKKPRIKWESYQERRPEPNEIAEWCRAWPDLQWGICTGPISNLLVVDTDSPEASAAVRALLPDSPEPVIVQTVSEGHKQFWFQCDLDIPQTQTVKKIRPDPAEWIDIRNRGGFVLAPGSKAYRKDPQGNLTTALGHSRFALPRDGTKDMTQIIRDRPKPSPGLKNMLLRTRPTNANGSSPPPSFPPIKEGEKVPVGTREGFLFNKALNLVDAGLPRPVVELATAALAANYLEPGDAPKAEQKVQSAYEYREKHPKPPTEEAYDVNDVLLTGPQIKALETRVEWIIDRLLPERALTLIHGPGGLGKTWLAFALSKAVTEGLPFLGLATKQCPVVYVDLENPLSVFHDKVCKRDLGENFRAWHLSFPHRPPKLDSKNWEKYKELPGGSMLVYDTARACHDGKENDSDVAALVMGHLKEVRELDHHIILLGHTPRANERASKGSTAWEDLADQVLAFYPVNKKTREELADGGEFDPDALLFLGTGVKSRFERIRLFVKLDPHTGEFTLADDPNGEVIDALAEHIVGAGHNQNQTELRAWAAEQGIGPKTKAAFISVLNRGEREGRWRSRQEGTSRRYTSE